MYTVAVSYLEWIRWVATGWFRCADRVVWVEGSGDQQGVDALMDRAPDLQVSDDQGYVIACLKPEALTSGRHNGRERSVGHLWLSVAAVSSFHPLSSRGARLLEADAERAAVRLDEPLFEMLWIDWRDRRLEDEAHWRGFSLCTAFGLEFPPSTKMSNKVIDVLAGRKSAPNAADVREGAFEGTRALGWVSAMSVAVIDPAVKAAFKETPENGKIKALIKAFREDFDLRSPLLNDESLIKFSRNIDEVLRNLGAEVLPLELMATVLHYRSLAAGDRQLSLNALTEDLVVIALGDPYHASLSAYFIGRGMENVAVTTLLYQSEPVLYKALVPAAGRQQLNVMALAAARLEVKQPVNQVQKTNPSTSSTAVMVGANRRLDATNAAAEVERVEQPVEDQLHVHDDMNARTDGPAEVAISPPSLDGDSKGETFTEDSLGASVKPQERNIPEPSEGSVKDMNQPENSSVESKAEMVQQTMDGLEPITSPGKSRKNRKKSDKPPAIRSVAETSDDKLDK